MVLKGLQNRDLKLILFGGKGGVGKTSCAVATAINLSKNFKTLLISTDPAHSISDSLEQNIGFRQQQINNITHLTAIEIAADEAIATYMEQHEAEFRKFFDTTTNLDQEDITQLMNLSIPGIDEIMSFKSILDFIEEGNYDKYVVDAAPTGHTLRLLASPKLLDEWIKVAASIRWKYRYMITSFSGSYQPDDVDTLLLDLKRSVKRIERLLSDNTRCEFIPVCVPEQMAINETQRLLISLKKLTIDVKQIIVNHVMESEEGDFCRRKKAYQINYLKMIDETFGNMTKVYIPMFPEEVKGITALNQLGAYLFDD